MKKILIEDSLLLIVLSVLLSTAFLLLTNTVIYLITTRNFKRDYGVAK